MAAVDLKGSQFSDVVLKSPPRFEQNAYSPHSIAAIFAELAAQGTDTSVVLAGTGLVASQLDSHTTKISYRQIDIVVRNALRLTTDPAIGLRAGQRMRVTAYGMYGYALLSSATREDARNFAARYIRVVGPFCDFVRTYSSETITCTFQPLHWPNATEAVHRFAVEFALSAHLSVTRDRLGSSYGFTRVFVDYPAPSYAPLYESLLECPAVFGQALCGYDQNRDDGPVSLADPRTYAMAREMCEQVLDEIDQTAGVASDIRRMLIQQPGRFPSIDTIAEKLQMHPRALRRRLEAEGVSYRDVLADLRMRLAIEYLRKTRMTNEEIAGRLGYSDAANFRHAFQRWTGKSPSDFRRAVNL